MRPAFILFFTCFLFINAWAQDLDGKLQSAQCIVFRNCIYVSGYEEGDKGIQLKTTRYTFKLEKQNEVTKVLGKGKLTDLYPPNYDTTHGFLSVVAQKTNNDKTASLIRYNENLGTASQADNAEITRINSFAAFDNEKLYYRKQLYIVREAKDSAGRFYFYRYDLRDSSALFNYNFKWQFNFDQHNYHRIHPLYATDEQVYLYVISLDGDRKGQWILILNTANGDLIKAVKLNKNDNEVCFVSRFEVYGGAMDMAVAGVKYSAGGVDLKNGNFTVNYQGSKSMNMFFCQIDSAGEIKTRLENFPGVPNDILKEKEVKDMMLRCNKLEKTESGFDMNYECMYKGKDGIYRTYGFLLTKLNQTPEGMFKPENNAFLACYRNDKAQPKGKTGNPNCKQTANQYDNDKARDADRLFYKNAFVKNFTETGTEINSQKKLGWLVSYYHNKKTGNVELFKYSMKNYTWETATLKNLSEFSRCNVISLGTNRFLIFNSAKDESNFILSVTEL